MLMMEFTEPANRKEIEASIQPFLNFLLSGKEIPLKAIARKLEQATKSIGVDDVTIVQSKNVEVGDMNMNASYDPVDDKDGLDHFELDLIFSNQDKTIAFSPEGVENIKHRIVDVLEHELIHKDQYRGRGFKKQREFKPKKGLSDKVRRTREYLGNDDEIEAYAKNIASELIRKSDKETALTLLRMAGKTAQYREKKNLLSPNLFGYFAAFDFDTSHPVIRKLLKKIFFYIEREDG
ncbi:MAG: hypothetical protein CMA31_02975 [Euryarchaeota archaeon]|nr:hypothetical protein [Euryarchaeota archaeon]|tara:strand:+ start:1035 stop:1742 length:708 start_codon:yes stop_codon:yes gene_type:complete